MTEITRVLQRIEFGDTLASNELLPLVYNDLRKLAARELSKECPSHTLQPTALVHEAYLRLVDQSPEPTWRHRGHFYLAAAQAMRRILIEHARRKRSLKRGGNLARAAFVDAALEAPASDPELLAIDEALSRLFESRPDCARLVTLRYFGGLTMKQAAASLGMSLRTAERNWSYARAWLLEAMSPSDSA